MYAVLPFFISVNFAKFDLLLISIHLFSLQIIIIIIITHIYIYRRHHSCNKSSLCNSNLCRLQRRREKIYKTTLAAELNNSVFSLSLNKSSDGAKRVLKLKLFQTAGAEQ